MRIYGSDQFDGFDVIVLSNERVDTIGNTIDVNYIWEAYLVELPEVNVVSTSANDVISELKIRWENYKNELIEQEKDIPIIPISKLHRLIVTEAIKRNIKLISLIRLILLSDENIEIGI